MKSCAAFPTFRSQKYFTLHAFPIFSSCSSNSQHRRQCHFVKDPCTHHVLHTFQFSIWKIPNALLAYIFNAVTQSFQVRLSGFLVRTIAAHVYWTPTPLMPTCLETLRCSACLHFALFLLSIVLSTFALLFEYLLCVFQSRDIKIRKAKQWRINKNMPWHNRKIVREKCT